MGYVLSTAADAAIGQFQETAERGASLIHDEWLLYPHLSLCEFVLDDSVFLLGLLGEDASDEGGLAGCELAHQEIDPCWVVHGVCMGMGI